VDDYNNSGFYYMCKHKNKKLKLDTNYRIITFKYEPSDEEIYENISERAGICFYDSADVMYYQDVIKNALTNSNNISTDESSKRMCLLDLLERSVDTNNYILDSSAIPFAKFLDMIQQIFDKTNISTDPMMYLKVLLYAYRYGCLKLINIDQPLLNNIVKNRLHLNLEKNNTDDIIFWSKVIREACFNILKIKIDDVEKFLIDTFA